MRNKGVGHLLIGGGLLLVFALLVGVGAVSAAAFPDIVPLPDGFQPEGVVTGYGHELYAGSLADGSIYRANLRTGEGDVVVSAPEGGVAVGLDFDRRSGLLFVAGGGTGDAFVYDPQTGDTVASYELTTETNTFVNDVIVTRSAATFTDSFRPVLYRVPLGPGGSPAPATAVEEITLGGDFEFVPGAFNANGIEALPNGKALIVVNSTTGDLYLVDPASGEATLIDLGGGSVPFGDGILLQGKTLYVVQNQLNQIAVVELAPDTLSGEITGTITDAAFDVPTTIASFGPYLYAVNARFGTAPGPDVEYDVVQVRR